MILVPYCLYFYFSVSCIPREREIPVLIMIMHVVGVLDGLRLDALLEVGGEVEVVHGVLMTLQRRWRSASSVSSPVCSEITVCRYDKVH